MLDIINLTHRKIPRINWGRTKNAILGEKYNLSLVFTGNALMKKLNKTYRRKNKAASALSFPLSAQNGEIFINLSQKTHSPASLFIHSLLHLKGHKHGQKMEKEETKYSKKFSLH